MTKEIINLDSVQIGDCFILKFQDRVELFQVNRIDGYAISGEDYVIYNNRIIVFFDDELESTFLKFSKIDIFSYKALKTLINQGLLEISTYINSHSYINSNVHKADLRLEGNGIIIKVGSVDEDNNVYYDLYCSNENNYQLIDYSSECDIENCNIGSLEEIRQYVCFSKTTAKIANKKFRALCEKIAAEINRVVSEFLENSKCFSTMNMERISPDK